MKGYFRPDACVRWHNTNEQFTVDEFIRANCEYPGKWDGKVERVETKGDTIITVGIPLLFSGRISLISLGPNARFWFGDKKGVKYLFTPEKLSR